MSHLLRPSHILSALLLLGAAGGPASASQLMALDTTQLVSRAERIVIGTVLDQQSRWTGGGTIVTDVRVRVSTGMLGAKDGEIITVRRLGGEVKDVGMKVFGEASFQNGEEVMVFAERRGDAYFSVGMSQGTLHMTTENGRKMTQHLLTGAELVGKAQVRTGPRPLDEVVQEIRGAIAQKSAQKRPPATEVK